MIRKILLIILAGLFFISCGVKSDPEYKSQSNYNKTINLV